MKREIIFRGKCVSDSKYAGQWVEGGYVPPYEDSETKEALIVMFYGGNTTSTCHVIPETVGQYTGLTDKNGKRIFEGDILKVYYYGKSKIFGVVKFDESRFFIDDDFMRDDIKAKAPMTEMFSRYEFEVVGNVHDNPELLKGDSHEQNT